ncbi:transcriptional regulator with XRE-family HTH domain/predicted transcriptional regulator [Leucobacter exalbidus]|uniref:Transcriptional regulator with XRE-family HTH domain/predicted transcriptional regulator n=1 Tax=Leucobacter exalbidus TaxID=662960 RepID=A0A940PYN9_9MICO|nr:helix-turn-helix domain-containing protein [Leucobacter exalbidus]MBP1327471.1 transcriptional regulator with XRE-family HTH domain/predicted transcriptional regulator [Leucobacter exalbidus]
MPFDSLHTQSLADLDRLVLGKRIRHLRTQAGLTLGQLGDRVGVVASQLSLIENGRREPKLSLLQGISRELKVEPAELLRREAPDPRSALEIELERAQSSPGYLRLGLPHVRTPRTLGDEALKSLVGLHRELARRSRAAAASSEEARRANTEIRLQMRARDNYIQDIELVASDLMRRIGHGPGAVTHREVSMLAELLGFTLFFVDELPSNTRSITDLENGRIYLPPASIPGGHGLRSLALQAMAHRVLGHEEPSSYAEFLEQRMQINYFASACLIPEARAAEFLQQAKRNRNLAIEDFRDAFGVTHEAAAHRFSNIATRHLDLQVHHYRADGAGALVRGYENDGLPFPSDSSGSIEGQVLCHKWGGRSAFNRKNRTNEFYQFTDTPEGTFWTSVQTGDAEQGPFAIACGVRFNDAKWFRGTEKSGRMRSTCPDEDCCRRPNDDLLDRWRGKAWPSARMHQHVLSPLPTGTFPGVDDAEMYEFLAQHAPKEPGTATN